MKNPSNAFGSPPPGVVVSAWTKRFYAFWKALLNCSGGALSVLSAARFFAVAVLAASFEVGAFGVLQQLGLSPLLAQLASVSGAMAGTYWLSRYWVFDLANTARLRLIGRFMAITLMAMFLRAGLADLAATYWGWSAQLAFVFAVAISTVVTYFGFALYVFPRGKNDVLLRWRLAAAGVVAYAVVIRLIYMRTLNLMPEEAYYWNYAQHLDIGYLDHPPMVAWLIWLTTLVFGTNEFAVRAGAMLMWIIAAAFCFATTRNLCGKQPAWIAAMLVATLPFFFSAGLLMNPDAPLTAAWAAVLYFAERALIAEKKAAWIGMGVSFGLGLLSKYSIALLAPPVLLFMVFEPRARTWFRKPWPYLGAALALVIFTPVVYWNASHHWASFAFQSVNRLRAPVHFTVPFLLGYVAALLTPVGVFSAYRVLMERWPVTESGRSVASDRWWMFTALFTLFPLTVFGLFSSFHIVKLNWTGPLWLAVVPAIAHLISSEQASTENGIFSMRSGWASTIPVVLVLTGAALSYLTVGLPGVAYPSSANFHDLPVGWRDFGRRVSEIELQARSAADPHPIFVGMDKYFLASEIAFYDGDRDGSGESAGRSLFGADSLMYDFWFPRAEQTGHTIALFSFDPESLADEKVAGHFRDVGPVIKETLSRADRTVRNFYYRIGYGYRANL